MKNLLFLFSLLMQTITNISSEDYNEIEEKLLKKVLSNEENLIKKTNDLYYYQSNEEVSIEDVDVTEEEPSVQIIPLLKKKINKIIEINEDDDNDINEKENGVEIKIPESAKKSDIKYDQKIKSIYYKIRSFKKNIYSQTNKIELENTQNKNIVLKVLYDTLNYDLVYKIENKCLIEANTDYKLCMKWTEFALSCYFHIKLQILKENFYYVYFFITYNTLQKDIFKSFSDWILDESFYKNAISNNVKILEEYKQYFFDEN
jgi:hypothetical protein